MSEKQLHRFTFHKSERLSRKRHIDDLFKRGSSFFLHPIKTLYLFHNLEGVTGHQVLISVSKKHHRKAVDRNRIKRLVREAYRINKHILANEPSGKLFIAYIYVSKEISSFEEIESKLKQILERLKSISRKSISS